MSNAAPPPFRCCRLGCLFILLAGSTLGFAAFGQQLPSTNSMPGADFFAEGSVCRLEVQIKPPALKQLEKEAREFVHATIREGDVTYPDVEVHLKGSVGSFRPLNDKPGLTIDFSRYGENQRFHGLRRIHLNNSVEDPSYCNEALGSEMFRAAGIPCPRVTHALVTLNGRKLGLYVLKEGFTEDFLSGYFQSVGGNLFEPGDGHDVNEHLRRSSIRGTTSNRKTLKALAEAALESDPRRRWERLCGVLEMEPFLKFMALEILLCHRDGYCLARNNFRVYEDVDKGKMMFLPQGMDQLFGIPELPLVPNMAGLVARAVLETPEGRGRYLQASTELFHQLFQSPALTKRVHQLVQPLRSAVNQSEFEGIESSAEQLIARIAKRHQFLEHQIINGSEKTLSFSNGVASLTNWTKADEPVSGSMNREIGSDGVLCLSILTQTEACAFWHTKARLGPGRYRFEGKVRVANVKPLGFGTHQGAGLRVSGAVRASGDVIGTKAWQQIVAPFEVEGSVQEVEFICELRARSGEAWFDAGSLRVAEER